MAATPQQWIDCAALPTWEARMAQFKVLADEQDPLTNYAADPLYEQAAEAQVAMLTQMGIVL